TVGANLGGHQAFRPWPEADQHGLPGAQLGDAVAAQRLHVHEDVWRALAAGQETEAAQAVEPFDLRALEPAGRGDGDVRPRRRHLRRVDRGRLVHGENTENLQALGPLQHLADDARALVGGLVAVAAQAGYVQEHIRHAVVGYDETKSLGDIEPLDDARQLDEIGTRFIDKFSDRPRPEIAARHF